tara:strand:+ start:22133 stop:22999 length:867 start_codon:yes stop_codon:yes gene_type:complete
MNAAIDFAGCTLSKPFQVTWRSAFDELCHTNPVWISPFFQVMAGADGSSQQRHDMATIWALNMLQGSYAFPSYVAALAARSDIDSVRHGLLENAWDEAGGVHRTSRSHFWLAVRLAECLGFNASLAKALPSLPASHAYMESHKTSATSGDFDEALGMICLIEEFTTPEFSRIATGLISAVNEIGPKRVEDFILDGGGEYFTANISDDERHREEMPKIAATLLAARGVDLDSPSAIQKGLEPILAGSKKSIALRAKFLDEIYQLVMDGLTPLGFWQSRCFSLETQTECT